MDDRELVTDILIFVVALVIVAMAWMFSEKKRQHDAFIRECSQVRYTVDDCERLWGLGND